MIETVTGAITALRGTMAMIRTAIDARDDKKLGEVMTAINDRIIGVQDACMRLQETNATLQQEKHTLAQEKRDLEGEIAQLRQQTDRLAKYERTRLPSGALAFVETETKGDPGGAVYACASCADNGKISTLQPTPNGTKLRCATHGDIQFVADRPGADFALGVDRNWMG